MADINQKIVFGTLQPWLKILHFHPSQDPFPIHKCIHLIISIILLYIPNILFILNARDFGTFCSALTEFMAITLYYIQTMWLGYRMKKFKSFMEKFDDAWKCSFVTNTALWNETATKLTKFTSNVSKAVIYLYCVSSVFYVPIVGSSSIYRHVKNPDARLSFGVETNFYGLKSFETKLQYFIPIFLIDISTYIPMVVGYGVLAVLIPFLCNYLATYLKYIQLRLNNLYIEELTTKQMEKQIVQELKEICQKHRNAIRFVKTMDKLFNFIFLVKFVISSFFQCLLFYILAFVEDKYIVSKAVSLVLCLQIELWCICYYGDKLITESTKVCEAAYNVKWYNASVKVQKMISMIIVAGNKPLKVTAWDFTDVSIESYGYIMHRTYSYFTIMRNMFNKH